jgi:hypothetical protein
MTRRGSRAVVIHRTLYWAAALMLTVCVASLRVRADVASDQAAAIVVFPKIVVDTSGLTPRGPVDTLIRVSNTSNRPITMYCFLVDANGHCSNSGAVCNPFARPPESGCNISVEHCIADWQESDFVVRITARQPIAWLASRGAAFCEQSADPSLPCLPLSDQGRLGPNGQTNSRSLIQPVPEDPFIGELKCIAVNDVDNLVPVERNDLKGEAEIVRSAPGVLDVAAYNAIGIPAVANTNNGNRTLVLGGTVCQGGPNAESPCTDEADCSGAPCGPGEYSSCPNILILDHFFDGATDPVSQEQVTTHLTLVPCSEDFLTQTLVTTTVQFLVFNEFEQRVSTSRPISCFQEFKISDIQGSGDRSIFSAAVQGTLTGQTRLRGVADQHQTHGHTLLGVAEEFREGGGTAAFNLHFQGRRSQSDFIYLP